MKVLHFTNSYYPSVGGIENVIENLCVQLKKNGIESDVLTVDTLKGKKLPKTESYKGHKIYRVPFIDLKYYKLSAIPFDILKNYDIIHIHSLGFFSDLMLAGKFIHKKKIIVSSNGGIFHTGAILGIKKIYFYLIEKMLLKNADKIIAISRHDRELFGKIAAKNKIVIIEPGLSLPELRGGKQKGTFLYVGRLSKNKGIENLLEVFSRISLPFKLKIAGKDFDGILQELKEKATRLGIGKNVQFLGALSDKALWKECSTAEYAVSASKYEGFGITTIEAMHYNCICIFNSIPTFKQLCSSGRGNIVDYSKHEKTAKEIIKIMGKSKKDKTLMLKKAKNYSKKFFWKNNVKNFINLYSKVMQ